MKSVVFWPARSNPLPENVRNGSKFFSSSKSSFSQITSPFELTLATNDLNLSLSKGNNLITPIAYYNFPGLKAGDKWCLCASRWVEAEKAGKAPLVVLEATHEKTLDYTSLETLVKYAYVKT